MNHRFTNDYSETTHPGILKAIADAAGEQNTGYGLDVHSEHAEKLILERFGIPGGKVFFLQGGTQTNATVLSFLLKPYEAVLACGTGHINVHETGAVEGTGHKVFTCPGADGKLSAEDVHRAVAYNRDEHMVKIRAVYISNATETGTVYTAEELGAIRSACDEHGLFLFMDGARIGAALTSEGNDVTPELIGEICDVFYVGGTKNGMLFGEAVVFRNAAQAEYFRHHMKNRGAMAAKGFVAGIMFERAFKDDLYFEMAEQANRTADHIRKSITGKAEFYGNSTTNQIFVKLGKKEAFELIEKFGCELWSEDEDSAVVRIVTSFATKEEDCAELIGFFNRQN
ncbi:MAG: aminotransferase class I/II-fold pyridoxal phosphate-dependent enzyme [Clostridia bacterium]|nr:aminotransferase class I/II-fold pyridoxal phosphate-dependent enzyme [Clostridia bacterium]